MEGRAVYKELENRDGQKYGAWIQIDFDKRDKSNNHEVKQFHDAYGYDLKGALEKYNIREIKEPDLADILMQSLKKGNLQGVAIEKDGGVVRAFVEANPQFKSVTLYDGELKRVPKESLAQFQVQGAGAVKEQREQKVGQGSKQKNSSVVETSKPTKGKGTGHAVGR